MSAANVWPCWFFYLQEHYWSILKQQKLRASRQLITSWHRLHELITEYKAWRRLNGRLRPPLCLIIAQENISKHTARAANHHSHTISHTISPSVCLSKEHWFRFPCASFQTFNSVTLLPHARLDSKHHQLLKMQQGSLTFQSPISSMYAGQCFDKRLSAILLDSPWCDVTAHYVRVVAPPANMHCPQKIWKKKYILICLFVCLY